MKNLRFFVEDVNVKKIDGKDSEKNGTEKEDGIRWGLNEPKSNEAINKNKIDKKTLNRNTKRLLNKFKTEEPFFIQGKAGWGKTSIIVDMAHRFGYEVITVYLDKARAEDLGGTPVPDKDKNNEAYLAELLPSWAQIMRSHPKQNYLLFFDEMNQAQLDVQNALMPIVLENTIAGIKFDNFFVGAAGNFESENDAVNVLQGPLKQRFMPIIVWESDTDESWKSAFEFIHKSWDDKLGKNFVDRLEECASIFISPRIVDHKICKFVYKLKVALERDGDEDWNDVDDYLERLEECSNEDLSAAQEKKREKLAEYIFNYMRGNDEGEKKSSSKNSDMIDKNLLKEIKDAIETGYIATLDEHNKVIKYGVSRENILDIVDDEDVNREMLERTIKNLEKSGVKFKFETNKQFLDKGLLLAN